MSSDHRILRAEIRINTKLGRIKLCHQKPTSFNTGDELKKHIVRSITTAAEKIVDKKRNQKRRWKVQTEKINETIKKNRGNKVFRKQIAAENRHISKITIDGRTVTERDEILKVVKNFYQRLCNLQKPRTQLPVDRRARLSKHSTEDLPEISKQLSIPTSGRICTSWSASINKEHQKNKIDRKIQLAWGAFGKLKNLFKSDLRQSWKSKTWDECILLVLTYGCKTWSITTHYPNRLQVAQREMERSMLGISIRERKTNEYGPEWKGICGAGKTNNGGRGKEGEAGDVRERGGKTT
ncbi:hypothetical protein ILUMI_23264 [Ignelater luminosus]|uniref:Endonuclease-reverse transcriptase n=1 Tax=Ignelater luminosus TaxID=2038154 RepID=A0A8K0CFL8_IGNLU|nr:hypothetical protein ILUMI_23264 [Ignelater luminosus]